MSSEALSDVELVTALYRAFLRREPAPSELEYHVNQLTGGNRNARQLIAAFADCEEYRVSRAASREQPRQLWVPPGHFYSPIVDTEILRSDSGRVFDRSRRPAEIELNEAFQIALVPMIRQIASDLPFTAEKNGDLFYYLNNEAYSYGDAIVLSAMICHLKPRRIIEFGSGFSSCLMIDINRLYFDNQIDLTFVDPHPELLLQLLEGRGTSAKIVQSRAQDLELDLVRALEPNDILFIDSTHVAKAGSDVNFHIFEILPALKTGVAIHFHDIFYPFEYPEAWFFRQNRSWNEIYLLRAFLMHNTKFAIQFFNDFMMRLHPALMDSVPGFTDGPGGALWLRKVA